MLEDADLLVRRGHGRPHQLPEHDEPGEGEQDVDRVAESVMLRVGENAEEYRAENDCARERPAPAAGSIRGNRRRAPPDLSDAARLLPHEQVGARSSVTESPRTALRVTMLKGVALRPTSAIPRVTTAAEIRLARQR